MATKKNTTPAFVIVDGAQIDVDVHNVALDDILKELVSETKDIRKRETGMYVRIAAKFNDLMPFAWYDIEPDEKSAEQDLFAPHKKAFYKSLRDAGHSNPSVQGKRVRDYGRNMRAGLAPNGLTMADGSPLPETGEGEGEGEGEASKRSITLRNVEELIKLYKANKKAIDANDCPAQVADAQVGIVAALTALGVSIATIK